MDNNDIIDISWPFIDLLQGKDAIINTDQISIEPDIKTSVIHVLDIV